MTAQIRPPRRLSNPLHLRNSLGRKLHSNCCRRCNSGKCKCSRRDNRASILKLPAYGLRRRSPDKHRKITTSNNDQR